MVVDRLTKCAYFISMKGTRTKTTLATLYVKELVRLYALSVSIVSDRDQLFTSLEDLGKTIYLWWISRITIVTRPS